MSVTGKNISALRAAAKRGLILLTFLAMTAPVLACPMCKDSTVTDSNPGTTTTSEAGLSFNKSIYFMLGGLATIASFTGRVMCKAAKSPHPPSNS